VVPQSTSANTDRLRIFISSTITDLGPEREAIKEAIQELQLGPVFAEGFGGRPATPNGTLVNGQRILKQALEDGDEIEMGRTTLIFKRVGTVEQAPKGKARLQ
jgi:pSer/pThr/pTyr-binding forkhead associated (FHA) protein